MIINNFISSILILTCLIAISSCGSDDDSSSSGDMQQEQQSDEGIYRAVLRPLNGRASGDSRGTFEIIIDEENLIIASHLIGTPSGIKHYQNIMSGSSCPETPADSNNDSFIDFQEALQVTGPILVPLDSDLSEQLNGMDYGPVASSSGSYVYRRSTSLAEFFSDLRVPDPVPEDHLIKLPADQSLNMGNRVVMIHSVKSSANLPDSVATSGTMSQEESLPIACGELVRIISEESE